MTASVVALFGEAQKGAINRAYYCRTLEELFCSLGEPPESTLGLYYAVQTLFYKRPILYFRVREEGISFDDYLAGFRLLSSLHSPIITLQALFLPGVGSPELLDRGILLCREQHSFLLLNENDFFDYISS